MNDYKELIDSLRICVKYKKAVEALCNAEFAADAIEQLVKERDAAVNDLKYLPFTTCKWVNTDRCKNSCLCERYEWRGVQVDDAW